MDIFLILPEDSSFLHHLSYPLVCLVSSRL